jgi:FtsH-binding integral membrane protein
LAKKRKRRRRPAPRPAASQAPEGASGDASSQRPARSRKPADGPPEAPWGSFPLVELVIFVGLVLLVVGFIAGGGSGTILIITGLVLASLGGLELSVREHFSGYRSHTTLLAGLAAVACLAILFFGAPSLLSPYVRIGAALAVFGLAAWWLTTIFRRASGGLAFRIRGFRG